MKPLLRSNKVYIMRMKKRKRIKREEYKKSNKRIKK